MCCGSPIPTTTRPSGVRSEHGGEVPDANLADKLGLFRSRLLARVRPPEKLGWVSRAVDDADPPLQLSPAGRRLLKDARATAASACAELSVS